MSYETTSVQDMSDDQRRDELQRDDSPGQAWADFAEQFAYEAMSLDAEEMMSISVYPGQGDNSPRISAYLHDVEEVVFLEASSNETLPPETHLSAEQIDQLLNLGWAPPSAPKDDLHIDSFHVVGPTTSLDEMAQLVVDTLQTVFGIPHPSFLLPARSEDRIHDQQSTDEPLEDPHAGEELLPIDEAYHPADAADLEWAISHVIRNSQGVYVPRAEDGAFRVIMGSTGLQINVRDPQVISLLSFPVIEMRHPERAAEKLADLNDDSRYVRFYVDGEDLVAACDLPGDPFVPKHLIEVMIVMEKTISMVDAELASVTGGTRPFEDFDDDDNDDTVGGFAGSSGLSLLGLDDLDDVDDDDDDAFDEDQDSDFGDDLLPEELQVLLHMENDPASDVTPELAAQIFGHDRALILESIALCEDQATLWDESAVEEDDDDLKEAYRDETDSWDDTASLLREALDITKN